MQSPNRKKLQATASPSTSSSPIRGTPRGKRRERGAVELLPDRGREARASGRSRQRASCSRNASSSAGTSSSRSRATSNETSPSCPSCLRRRRCRLRRFEDVLARYTSSTRLEVEHGRLRARHQPEALSAGGGGEAAGLRQPEEVGEVGAGACRALDEQLHGRRMGAVRHQDVGERGGVLAEEARDPQPAPVLDEQRQGAGEPVSLARDVDGEAVPAGGGATTRAASRAAGTGSAAASPPPAGPTRPESGELARVGDGGDRRDHAARRRRAGPSRRGGRGASPPAGGRGG